jgi:cell division protein FtsB
VRSPYAVRRPVENPFLVRERDRRLLVELMALAGTVLLIGGCLWAYTWLNIATTKRAYEVNRLDQRLQLLIEEERRLELEAAQLTQPRLIEKRAQDELGMHQVQHEQTLFYEELVP